MTEAQWLACDRPHPLLLHAGSKGADLRRVRLLGCACARRVWHLLTDPRSRLAVEVAERFADGQATAQEMEAARKEADKAGRKLDRSGPDGEARGLAADIAVAVAGKRLRPGLGLIKGAMAAGGRSWDRRVAETVWQADLVRDLFGNPFRPVAFDPLWRQQGDVFRLAEAIYHEHRFAELPVLADALEDAGCAEPTVLRHCRQGGSHARGCWLVDLVLRS
jgi:hypothetical protein